MTEEPCHPVHGGASAGSLPGSLASIPETAGADPFSGEALHYERRADGSALLDLPGAEAAYKEMTHVANSCPFSWEIRPQAPRFPTPGP